MCAESEIRGVGSLLSIYLQNPNIKGHDITGLVVVNIKYNWKKNPTKLSGDFRRFRLQFLDVKYGHQNTLSLYSIVSAFVCYLRVIQV